MARIKVPGRGTYDLDSPSGKYWVKRLQQEREDQEQRDREKARAAARWAQNQEDARERIKKGSTTEAFFLYPFYDTPGA